MKKLFGYHGIILEINLTSRKIKKIPLSIDDIEKFIGGRGLGMKILWDNIKKPGIDPLSPGNPLIFIPGPFSGFPIPSASRTCVVTKSPCTFPEKSDLPFASTVSYSLIGGFFGAEIRFAGYDGILVKGKASSPVYINIDDRNVKICDSKKFWGMKTDEFDKKFIDELGDRRYRTCYIGPAGESLVSYASIIHTASRAAGRGTGAVMGSKNLKAIAVRGSKMPGVAQHEKFIEKLDDSRNYFNGFSSGRLLKKFWENGTASFLEKNSKKGFMAVKNYHEGTFEHIDKIGAEISRKNIWIRSSACYCCPLACKKNGFVQTGKYSGMVHDGPEYETGTMLGANLFVSDIGGLMKAISDTDDYGMDSISTGNVIGFLMDAHDRGYINKKFLDGIDLRWGNVDAIIKMIKKIAYRDGIGDLASKGVKTISKKIGKGSHKFANHVKGLELAAWGVRVNAGRGLSYVTSNRGACHHSGSSVKQQNFNALVDSLGVCSFAGDHAKWFAPGYDNKDFVDFMITITGGRWTKNKLLKAGERIVNLEKMFNYREGFRRNDDILPDIFFEKPFTRGPEKGAVLDKRKFNTKLTEYYKKRGWNPETTQPGANKLKSLGLSFVMNIKNSFL